MRKNDIFIGLLVSITLATFSFLASSSPDGLERVAEDKNFIEKAVNIIKAPIPDYLFPKIDNGKLAGSVAGIAGVLTVFTLGIIIAKVVKKK
ncbi:MAG: PDGLE domain-containing protein [Candidatus Omnitrophica bacterium]|nr:PDGLE domain-containing protein [Candidatus Omnitrophota bacterium]